MTTNRNTGCPSLRENFFLHSTPLSFSPPPPPPSNIKGALDFFGVNLHQLLIIRRSMQGMYKSTRILLAGNNSIVCLLNLGSVGRIFDLVVLERVFTGTSILRFLRIVCALVRVQAIWRKRPTQMPKYLRRTYHLQT